MSQPEDPTASIPDLIGMIDMPAEVERIRAARFTGRDRDNLVTAVVDGDGVVVQISFGALVGSRTPDVVEDAVLAAVAAAQDQTDDAWHALAVRLAPPDAGATAPEALADGLELAYDPTAEGDAHDR
jgi:DNA-binding protein YbaB